jgi:hypothetical protein
VDATPVTTVSLYTSLVNIDWNTMVPETVKFPLLTCTITAQFDKMAMANYEEETDSVTF